MVSNSHQYQFWNWCLPAIKQFWNWCQTAININFEIGVCQHLHIFTLDYIYDMCFKHIHTLHVSVICNKITYDLLLLQVQFSSRSGRHKSWNFSQFLTKNCSTVNSRGNLILKMVLASNLYQFQIGVCQQFIWIIKVWVFFIISKI